MNKAAERHINKTNLLQNSRHPKQVPSFPIPALAHAPPAVRRIARPTTSRFNSRLETRAYSCPNHWYMLAHTGPFFWRYRGVSAWEIYTDLALAVQR